MSAFNPTSDPPDSPHLATPWTRRDAAVATLAALVSYFAIFGAFLIPISGRDPDSTTVLTVGLFATLVWQLSVIALVVEMTRRKNAGPEALGVRAPVSEGSTLGIPSYVLMVVGAFIAAEITIAIYQTIASLSGLDALQPEGQLPENIFDTTRVTILTGITVVITAPIAEELLFRGVIFAGLRNAWGLRWAAGASGLLFAVVHAQSGLIIPFAVIGAIFAYTYHRSGSIFTNMAVHCIFNLLSFTILVLIPEARS